jgi:anti-sigma B factor antagonist
MTTMEAHVAPFQVATITASDCAVMRIAGEIDAYTAPELRQQVISLADAGTLHIVADLRAVDFLDSTGLGVLVASLRRMRLREGSLKLVVSGGRILQLFDITGLSRAFALHASVLDAISADRHWQAALAGEGHGAEEWCRKHQVP